MTPIHPVVFFLLLLSPCTSAAMSAVVRVWQTEPALPNVRVPPPLAGLSQGDYTSLCPCSPEQPCGRALTSGTWEKTSAAYRADLQQPSWEPPYSLPSTPSQMQKLQDEPPNPWEMAESLGRIEAQFLNDQGASQSANILLDPVMWEINFLQCQTTEIWDLGAVCCSS